MQESWQTFLAQYPAQPSPLTGNWITDLSGQGWLSVSGRDAKKLLQGQFTCDIEQVPFLQGMLGAHCNPQGRIISLFRLFFFQNRFLLHMPKTTLPSAFSALKKYAAFFQVNLEDVSDSILSLGYCGETSPLSSLENNADIIATALPATLQRYQIVGEYSAITACFKALALNTTYVSSHHWKAHDMAEGIPAIYPETSGKFLPHDLQLPSLGGVSFSKGCYTGQEIIARMHYRGKLKNRLFRAKLHSSSLPIRGADLTAAGTIVDFCELDKNCYELLFIAQDSDIQSPLFLDTEKQHRLELVDLFFPPNPQANVP